MYQKFSKSGVDIPSLGLGTWDLKQSECSRVVSEALDLGYRHIDAAAMYENESEVGSGIVDSGVDRDELFLATKINTTSWTPSGGFGPQLQNKNIIKSLEKSLVDLKTDYVDLLLIHWPKFETNLGDMLEIMYEIKDSQKAKEIGVHHHQIGKIWFGCLFLWFFLRPPKERLCCFFIIYFLNSCLYRFALNAF